MTIQQILAQKLKEKSGNVDSKIDNTTSISDNRNVHASTDTDIVVSILKSSSSKPTITLNPKQLRAHDLILDGKSICLIGAAGTGKTTSMKQTTEDLLAKAHIPPMTVSTKYLRVGIPGIVILSYTRKAVNNIRKQVVNELKPHTMTIHKLLEFAPVRYEIADPATGGFKTTMKFEPQKNKDNPLPEELKIVIWEESSMIGTQLYNQFRAAIRHPIQEIFLGDIQQLPPVFSTGVLGFKMLELPAIELTDVYRQALESPIISLAWDILGGDSTKFSGQLIKDKSTGRIACPALDAYNRDTNSGNLRFQYWQSPTNETTALKATTYLFTKWYEEGYYNPDEDIILCPQNIKFGTIEINKHIAQYFSVLRGAPVHEIVAGFERVYWAIGDRVLYDKEDAFIEDIQPNPAYAGKTDYAIPAVHMDRNGALQASITAEELADAEAKQQKLGDEQVDYFLESDNLEEIEERVQAASHIVSVRISNPDKDKEEIIRLGKASELSGANGLLGGYCITIHKAQGSEWEKVFIWLHHSHNPKMIARELLYTAVTRAKSYLHIMCETSSFEKGIKRQAIKGNTLAEKALIFKGKLGGGNEIPKESQDLDISKLVQDMQAKKAALEVPAKDTSVDEPTSVVETPKQSTTIFDKEARIKQLLDQLQRKNRIIIKSKNRGEVG